MKPNLATFLLAVPSLINGESNLRGADRELREKVGTSAKWNERTGKCKGQRCGLWGDPHMVTCDGYTYDCQGTGIFTLMRNELWDVQGTFVTVGDREKESVGLTHASVTNDVMINLTAVDDYPLFQAGFGDLSSHDGTHPSEIGCKAGYYYKNTDMKGQKRSVESTIRKCRERCETVTDCTKFSWWKDGGCHLNSEGQKERKINPSWTKGFAGTLDSECGKEHEVKELEDETERDNHGEIWNHCPLLMYLDGEMIDISGKKDEFLVGDGDSNFSVEMQGNRNVLVSYKVGDGVDDWAVVRLMAEGDGPGELWSCHWSVWVCIPKIYQSTPLTTETVGLLGSPDGDTSNDWMQPDGTPIPLDPSKNHGTSIAYCYDNWCVPQDKSLMTYPGDTTYEDWKCEEHDYKDYTNTETAEEEECEVGGKMIEKHCLDTIDIYRHNCEYDCCHGGCSIGDPEVPEGLIAITLNTDTEVPEVDIVDHRDCDGDDFKKTAKDVCPLTPGGVVELYHSSEGAPDIDVNKLFYGIIMDAEMHDDKNGKMVSFKINNHFDGGNVYTKHYESYLETFLDPACDATFNFAAGCPEDRKSPSSDIEVACHEYDGMTSFATFTVYMESADIKNENKVDDCCLADNPKPDTVIEEEMGVHKYTYKIMCDCPDVVVE